MERQTVAGTTQFPRFGVGQVVRHREQGFRGVVVDAHRDFSPPVDRTGILGDSERTGGPRPWYELLVHGTDKVAYVSEDKMEHDLSCMPIDHPLVRVFFHRFRHGRYELDGVEH